MSKIIKADLQVDIVTLNSDGWVNATAIASSYGKRIDHWLANKETKEYIEKLREIEGGEVLGVSRGRHGGTWIHPMLAVEFAGWIGGVKAKIMMAKIASLGESVIDALKDFDVPEDMPDMYVYAIREDESGRIKLGISRNPEQRLKQLQTGNSQKLSLVAYKKAGNGAVDEAALHEANKDLHVRGEWFDSGIDFKLGS